MIATRPLDEARRYTAAVVRKFIERWNERRAIDRLSAYPDAMLKDIGVSRQEIPFVVRHGRDRDKPRRHPAGGEALAQAQAAERAAQRHESPLSRLFLSCAAGLKKAA
jgi:uncharacterized protein YjiS (DUF1127 family)